MKITREGDMIRFQLIDIKRNMRLCDFKIPADAYESLKDHIIENLNKFKP